MQSDQFFEPKYFKIESLTKIIGNNQLVLIKLLEEIVKGSEKNFESLNLNYLSQNWEMIKNNAHFLKSNFRYLGCQEMTTVLKEIELEASSTANSGYEKNIKHISDLMINFNSNFPNIINEVKEYLQILKKV